MKLRKNTLPIFLYVVVDMMSYIFFFFKVRKNYVILEKIKVKSRGQRSIILKIAPGGWFNHQKKDKFILNTMQQIW